MNVKSILVKNSRLIDPYICEENVASIVHTNIHRDVLLAIGNTGIAVLSAFYSQPDTLSHYIDNTVTTVKELLTNL